MIALSKSVLYRRTLLVVLLPAVVVLLGCNKSRVTNSQGESSLETVTSSKPPFQTREPERYRATRIITTTVSPPSGSGSSRTRRISIARDGSSRREEYEMDSGERVVYLENSAGSFILLPSARMYADLSTATGGEVTLNAEDEIYNSIDGILNRVSSEATYRKLGPEYLHDRPTTKYRVSYVDGEGAPTTRETLVWVDETLGMPIRSETSYVNASSSTRVVMELRDLAVDVDQRIFELPAGFKNVTHQTVLEQVRSLSRK